MFKMPVAAPGRPGRGDDRRRRRRATGLDPGLDRHERDRAATRREGLRGADDRGRIDPGPRHRRDVRGPARRSRRIPTSPAAYRDGAALRRSAPTGRTRPCRWPRREVRELVAEAFGRARPAVEAVRGEGPRDRAPPGSSAAGSSASCSSGATRSCPIDNLVAGDEANLAEFAGHPGLLPFEVGDVRDAAACRRWTAGVDAVAHLAASISVQDSIDDPATTFENDVVGTFNLLEGARAAGRPVPVHEHVHGLRPGDARRPGSARPTRRSPPRRTPRRSCAGEALTLSYFHAYGLPTTVVRPFNTYGPFQRSVGEGGVVAIFTRPLAAAASRCASTATGPRRATCCTSRTAPGSSCDALALRRGDRPDPQRRDRARTSSVNELAGADRAGPGADRPRRAHPSAERDRGAALRFARGAASSWAGRPEVVARGGPRPRADLDGRTDWRSGLPVA